MKYFFLILRTFQDVFAYLQGYAYPRLNTTGLEELHRRFGVTFCPSCCFILSDCLHGLLFDPEDGGSKFLGNVSNILQVHATSQPRR
jgi:hypothetical protein